MSDSVSEHDSDSDNDLASSKEHPKTSETPTLDAKISPDTITNWQQNLEVDDTGSYSYTDPNSGVKYVWSEGQQSWIQRDIAVLGSGNVVESLKEEVGNQAPLQPWEQYLKEHEQKKEYTYTDPTDGTVFFWDAEKRAWFPKVDEDFIAAYQANYGVNNTEEQNTNNSNPTDNGKSKDGTGVVKELQKEDQNEVESRKRKADEKGWFDVDPEHNHNVYVSGLPLDYTDDEFYDLMSKCGIIMENSDTRESVTLALQLLDESDIRGHTVHVERAKFQLKGEYDPSRKPKKKKNKKKKAGQEKLLDWVDRDRKRSKFDRIVILKNMFSPNEFENNPTAVTEIRDDVKSECGKFGEVKKVMVFDRNPEGVCSVCFVDAEDADSCIEDDDEDDDSDDYIEADPENENNNGTDTEDQSDVGPEIGSAEGSDNE